MLASSFLLLAFLMWLAYRLLLNFLGVAVTPTVSALHPVAGSPAFAGVTAVAKGHVSTLFPVSNMHCK
jgi:hypothetical protein